MMKKYHFHSHQLDDAFRGYKTESTKKRLSAIKMSCTTTESSDSGRNLKALKSSLRGSTLALFPIQSKTSNPQDDKDFLNESDSDEDAIELSASDLEIFLNISRQEAEEMIFLADQDEVQDTENFQRTIDRDEFQQLLQNWS